MLMPDWATPTPWRASRRERTAEGAVLAAATGSVAELHSSVLEARRGPPANPQHGAAHTQGRTRPHRPPARPQWPRPGRDPRTTRTDSTSPSLATGAPIPIQQLSP